MKKTLLFLMAALALTACSKKENANSPAAGLNKAAEPEAKGLIAYVEIDSVMSQYEFCKESRALLEQHYKGYQQQLAAKESALENAAASFQKKIQTGQYTSQEAAQAEQNKLMGEQQKLEKLSAELTEKYAKKEEAAGKSLRDSLQSFLKEYNKDGRYALILSKSGDNVLYAQPQLDITNDVVSGLNKRYKKTAKK